MAEHNLLNPNSPETPESLPETSVESAPEQVSSPEVATEMREVVVESQELGEATESAVQEAQDLVEPQERPAEPAMQVAVKKDALTREIEEVLAEDLTDLYLSLPENKKAAFKAKGEEVAEKIRTMFQKGRVKTKKILDWIREWLRMVPGVNKFFLEQEAKIKTDRMMELYSLNMSSGSQENAI